MNEVRRTTGRASAVAGAHPFTGSLMLEWRVSQSLPGQEVGKQAASQSIPVHQGARAFWDHWDLPLWLLSCFKDTRVAEQCHLADGRSCLREGERLALLSNQRQKTFLLSWRKGGVSFSV